MGVRSSRFVLLVSLLGVIAAWCVALVMGPVSQADAPQDAASVSSPNALKGAARASAAGTHTAQLSGLGTEVVSDRTEQSKTFERADGTHVTRIYPEPVHYRDGDVWRSIDDTLVDAGGGYVHRTANSGDALIPTSLSEPFTVSKDGAWVRFALVGGTGPATVAGDTATVAGDTATFTGAADGVDAAYQAVSDGLKETLTLASPDARRVFAYDLTASDGLTARTASDGAVELVDGNGDVRFRFGAPVVWDSAATPAVSHASDLTLARTDAGWRLTLSVDRAWLQDPARSFPVTVDPDVYWATDWTMRFHGAQRDCTVASGSQASTSFCADPTLRVGSSSSQSYNSLLYFNLRSAIPQDARVYDATLALFEPGSATQSSSNLRLRPITRNWTSAATWNTADGTTAWSTPGGDVSTAAGDVGAPSSVNHEGYWYYFAAPVAPLQRAVWGTQGDYGLQLAADAGSPTQAYTFTSTDGSSAQWPALDVSWLPERGARGSFTRDTQQLSDRSSLSVNVADGVLTYENGDFTMPGTAGHGLQVTRRWDSTLANVWTTYGRGWVANYQDAGLRVDNDNSIMLWDESGAHWRYAPDGSGGYRTPDGGNAQLCKVGVTTGCSADSVASAAYRLTENQSGRKYYYLGSGYLAGIKDRNNNTISIAITSGSNNVFAGTQNHTITQSKNANNFVTSESDGTRSWGFTQGGSDNTRLMSATDPAGRSTSYDYTSDGYLSKITDPLGNVTTIDWDTPSLGARRVTKVVRVLDPADPTNPVKNPTTTYSYDFANHRTVVTDPVGNSTTSSTTDGQTTYTYNEQLQVNTAVDALGEETDTRYTPNGDTETFGDGTGTQNARLSTLTYANTGTNPTNNTTGGYTGSTGARLEQFGVNYCGDPSEAACGSDALQTYRPTRYTGSNGQFQTFGYDTSGNLTNVADGDSSRPAQNQATLSYDPSGSDTVARDGTLRSATDGNGSRTTFGYNSLRQLTSINPPGAGTNGVVGTQLGSTGMTYDSLGRLATLTDGKGQVHTFSYDPMDHMTKDLLGSGDYIRYTYDADGNLTQRDERRGGTTTTSTYGFDALNRVSSESFPSGQSNTYAYTLNSQLYTLTTTGGTTTYGYDAIDRVTSITDPSSAVVRYAYDDGTTGGTPRTITTTMPGSATTTTSLNQSGRPTSIVTKSSVGTVIQSRSYGYGWTDASGARVGAQVSSMSDLAGNATSYRYDQTGQLADAKKVNGSTTDELAWTFDRASNRTSKTRRLTGSADAVTSYKYNNNNQLCWTVPGSSANACNSTPTGGTGFTYDADGNQLTGGPGGSFTYDSYNRTTAMGSTSLGYLSPTQNELASFGSTSMQYTALGLSAEINGTAKTYIIRDPSGNAVAQRRVSGTTLQGTDYYVSDNIGSTTALLTSGSVARSWTYDPDGTPTSSGSGASTDILYAGGQSLSNGLTHFGARYYNPAIGRWTQQDPLQQISALTQANRYIYAGGDSVDASDPSGEACLNFALVTCAVRQAVDSVTHTSPKDVITAVKIACSYRGSKGFVRNTVEMFGENAVRVFEFGPTAAICGATGVVTSVQYIHGQVSD